MPVQQNDKTVVLTHPNGATVEVNLYGATVTSWKVDGTEHIFLSGKAKLDGSAAIRGGIPVVFPIFGAPPASPPEYAALKQHGFARNEYWTVDKVKMDRREGVSVRFLSPAPPASFGHQGVKLAYVVTLAAHQLVCDLHVVNGDDADFSFQALLHTYLRVPDASKVTINGIAQGVTYVDKVLGGVKGEATGDAIVIDRELDRVYAKIPSKEIVVNNGDNTGYKVHFNGFQDSTIWNPQEATGSKIGDMEAGGWNHYICVEPGYVSEWKTLKPGEEFIGQQTISLL